LVRAKEREASRHQVELMPIAGSTGRPGREAEPVFIPVALSQSDRASCLPETKWSLQRCTPTVLRWDRPAGTSVLESSCAALRCATLRLLS